MDAAIAVMQARCVSVVHEVPREPFHNPLALAFKQLLRNVHLHASELFGIELDTTCERGAGEREGAAGQDGAAWPRCRH